MTKANHKDSLSLENTGHQRLIDIGASSAVTHANTSCDMCGTLLRTSALHEQTYPINMCICQDVYMKDNHEIQMHPAIAASNNVVCCCHPIQHTCRSPVVEHRIACSQVLQVTKSMNVFPDSITTPVLSFHRLCGWFCNVTTDVRCLPKMQRCEAAAHAGKHLRQHQMLP